MLKWAYMAVSMKLLNLNIEGNLHFSTVLPRLCREQPEVVCLQEVFEIDLPLLEKTLGMKAIFLPTLNIVEKNPYRVSPRGYSGLAIFTSLKLNYIDCKLYQGSDKSKPPC